MEVLRRPFHPYPKKDSDFSGAVWNGYDAIKKIRYGPDWHKNISIPNTSLFNDLTGGTLPSVSWVIPTLFDSDHPASGCNGGPWWVTKIVNGVGKSKYWNDTAIVVLWDDWGGWYDNAPPEQTNYTSLVFACRWSSSRPMPSRTISKTQYDYGSILKFVEETFGLGSLGTSDSSATSMADIFDFTQKVAPKAVGAEPVLSIKKCIGSPSTSRSSTTTEAFPNKSSREGNGWRYATLRESCRRGETRRRFTRQEFADDPDVIVLALPRGGVPVGYEIATRLHAPLDVYVVRKLGVPGHEELAVRSGRERRQLRARRGAHRVARRRHDRAQRGRAA